MYVRLRALHLLVSSCSIGHALGHVTVPAGAELIFGDADIAATFRGLNVQSGGSILAGSPTCRLRSHITLTLSDGAREVGAAMTKKNKHGDGMSGSARRSAGGVWSRGS